MDISDIDREIAALESRLDSYSAMEKLSVLYTIRDHMEKPKPQSRYSGASKSEFVRVAESAPLDVLLSVMDEHMETIRLIYPKEYDAVIRKIK